MYLLLQMRFDTTELFSEDQKQTGKAAAFKAFVEQIPAEIVPLFTESELKNIQEDFRGAAQRKAKHKLYLKIDGMDEAAAKQIILNLANADLVETGFVLPERPVMPSPDNRPG